jgi:hypothetical protein
MLSALSILQDIMIAMPEQRKCRHCKHWQNGCKLAGGRMSPAHIQKAGCDTWMCDGVPV